MCRRFPNARRGLSLIELLTATAILTLVAAAIAVLSATVQTSNRHGHGHATATQHARVALERMERALREATVSAEFPGFAVFRKNISGQRYPDVLVVWLPASGTASNPLGRPLFSEVVVFRADPTEPNVLAEIRVPGDLRETPPISDTSQWASELNNLLSQTTFEQVPLTDLLRTASTSGGAPNGAAQRGAVRFEVEHTPDDADLVDGRAGTVAWKDLPWAQGIQGTQTGLRQARCRIELQLLPGDEAIELDESSITAVPYFGSASLLYEVKK